MITIKSSREIALMKKAGDIVAKVFDALEPLCIPGTTTKHLADVAEKVIRDCGGIPEEKGYYGYPAALCVSVNEQIVHGIPGKYKLKEGDIITFYSTNSFFGGTPITHRIIEVVNVPNSGKMFRVKGDANPKADEEKVIPSNVVGKVMFKIPQLGRVQFFLASKGGWIIAIMIPALVIISYDIYKIFRLFLLKSKLLSMENEHGNI